MDPAEAIAHEIRREGPIPFDRFVEHALYGPGGFFASGHGAGRGGRDFVTSPEVGPLFGVLVGRSLDVWWRAWGEPDPFVLVEVGAGTGRLARSLLRAAPDCTRALRYVLVERSAALREEQRAHLVIEPPDAALGPYVRGIDESLPVAGTGPVVTALDDLPVLDVPAVVFANELLDNLPFGIASWDGHRWLEVRVGLEGEHRFVEVVVPALPGDAAALAALSEGLDLRAGDRLPIPRGIDAWFARCAMSVHDAALVLVDYVVDARTVLDRGGWLRTHRAHGRGDDPLTAPGSQDLTADVVAGQLAHSARAHGFVPISERSQANWLRDLGIDALVDEGRRTWDERAHVGDLEAVAGRSRVHEAAALCDPGGLGAHRVVVLGRGLAAGPGPQAPG